MCRNILHVDGIVVDNILILSYYVVDDYIDGNTFTEDDWLMIIILLHHI